LIGPKRADPEKVRRAAARADRPGEACKAVPKNWAPQVDFRRCEGKGDCEEVCPYGVFEIRRIAPEDYSPLPWLAKLKLAAHGRRVAYAPDAESCLACGLCVVACPERAITLVRLADNGRELSTESR
jgi:NAD-dependent dihydropyrimidine dehydrogenase PreA subunit